MQEILARVIEIGGDALTVMLAAATTWALASLAAWAKSHAKTAEGKAVIERAESAAVRSVVLVEQVLVAELRQRATNGKLDASDAKAAMAAALDAAKAQLGPGGEAALAEVLGVSRAKPEERRAALEQCLIAMLESALVVAKARGFA